MLNGDDTSIVGRENGTGIRLSSTVLPAERIGKTNYRARCAIVLSRHVTYQQKTHVFGNIAPTIGGTWDGYGTVFGGGGSIRSQSESVVQVVYCEQDESEATAELPASISAREGTILRLDFLNGHLFAAQNLSGKQAPRGLLGPNDFIPWPQWHGALTFLIVLAFVALAMSSVIGVIVFAALPAYKIYQRIQVRRQRTQLGEYMGRALTASPF